MAKRLQHRGGTTSQHSTFTGAVREVTVDTDKNTLVVHDGATAGGHPLATATNFTSTGIDDNATSTAITIDSSERVGIGTSSPSRIVTVSGSTAPILALVETGTSGSSSVFFGDSSADNVGKIQYLHSSNDLAFTVNASERMRIDSNGKLLIGKTSSNETSTTGIQLHTDGEIFATRNGNALNVNRNGSTGRIINILKDGTAIGEIGARSNSSIYIDSKGSNQSGIEFDGDTIVPRRNGAVADNQVNLGYSGTKFKDLTLGGGVYLGGTASANKLDHYETGTWTPTVVSGTVSSTINRYERIGNVVILSARLTNFSDTTSSNAIFVQNFPFTPASSNNAYEGVARTNNSVPAKSSFLSYGSLAFYEDGTRRLHSTIDNSSSSYNFSLIYTTND